jgi:predicted nucleotidyltransferase
MRRTLVATNAQKILDFLIQSPGTQYLPREVQKATRVSKAGTNLALRDLVKVRLIKKEKRGSVSLYSVDFRQPVVKQLKVLRTIMSLSRLLERLKTTSTKVVLYGSCSRGEDTSESDIDLLVVTNAPQAVGRLVREHPAANKVQLTARTPLTYAEMEKTDPVFFREVELGIVLWESRDES